MPTPSSDQMEVDGMPDPAVNSSSSGEMKSVYSFVHVFHTRFRFDRLD